MACAETPDLRPSETSPSNTGPAITPLPVNFIFHLLMPKYKYISVINPLAGWSPYNFLVNLHTSPHLPKPSTMSSMCSIFSGRSCFASLLSEQSLHLFSPNKTWLLPEDTTSVDLSSGGCLFSHTGWGRVGVSLSPLPFSGLCAIVLCKSSPLSSPSSFHIWASHSFFVFLPVILSTPKPTKVCNDFKIYS